ncbi:autophagy protein 16 [Podospora australis]|uniref:Autophagy protein 16 n=1 Tax=Podospora australis TaxID=1536484 RepID=A0AAN6WRI8_9PEZI|nr:autophagy protein 16 [Podospora australis]
MQDWKQEYLVSIRDAEKQYPVNKELVAACSELCDRVSSLEAQCAALKAQYQPDEPSKGPPVSSSPRPTSTSFPASSADESGTVARLRLDLAESLRSKAQFQQRLQKSDEELVRLRAKYTADAKTIRDLTAERQRLSRKLRDREEELRDKSTLVRNVQDELNVLEMELNMVQKKLAEKEAENKHLVERFMRRIGEEAEKMNLEIDPLSSKRTK